MWGMAFEPSGIIKLPTGGIFAAFQQDCLKAPELTPAARHLRYLSGICEFSGQLEAIVKPVKTTVFS